MPDVCNIIERWDSTVITKGSTSQSPSKTPPKNDSQTLSDVINVGLALIPSLLIPKSLAWDMENTVADLTSLLDIEAKSNRNLSVQAAFRMF
jgi:hypothetical protein